MAASTRAAWLYVGMNTDTDGSGQVTGDGCGCTTERGSGRGLIGTLGLLLLMLPGIGRRRLRS